MWTYDVDNNAWTELTPADPGPAGRRVPWVRVAPDDSHFYFGYGNFFGEALDDLWVFDFESASFSEVILDDKPRARGFSRAQIGVLMHGFDMLDPVEDIMVLAADSDDAVWF